MSQPTNPEGSPRALAERARNALDALATWEDENSIFDATMMAIEDVQKVVKESGETARAWNWNEEMKEDVLAFLRTAHERIIELRTKRQPVFHRFSLYPGTGGANEEYKIGGRTKDKIGRDTPLSLLLQSALIAHMVIFARANGSVKGTIFQNPRKGELSREQILSRNRYIEGMLVGIVENLNILGWKSGSDRQAAVSTIVRHLPEMTSAMMTRALIRGVLDKAGGTFSSQTDDWIKTKFNYSAMIDILVGSPSTLEQAILSHATSALFLDDDEWLQKQLDGLNPSAMKLVFDSIRSYIANLRLSRSEKSLKERIQVLKKSAALFSDEKGLQTQLESVHRVTFSGSLSDVPPALLRHIIALHKDSLGFFASFLRGEVQPKLGGLNVDQIRVRLQPRILDPLEP